MSTRRQLLALTAMLLLAGPLAPAAMAADATARTHGASASPDDGIVTVQAQSVTTQYQAYGRVEPIAPLPVRAANTGVIVGLQVRPGTPVRMGQKLAGLAGAEIEATLARSQAVARTARARLATARRVLQIQRQQLTVQLTTRQALAEAQSALTAAATASDSAQAQLQAALSMRTLRAPCTGTVLAVDAANGERVIAGQNVLTLQAANQLWLRAEFYGVDAAGVRVGMTGRFDPADGGAPVAVRVSTVFGTLAVDGGESTGLLPAVPAGSGQPAAWLNGEAGTVTLDGPTRSLVSVPTRALILDQGRWWVLLHAQRADRARAVVPGATRGWQTFIERGLVPGQQVVVRDAYLEYHRGIAGRYQPPD